MSASAEGKPTAKKSREAARNVADKGKGDDAEVDVPDDFFDDFSNNDFMAGLDVVDAWEDGTNTSQSQDKARVEKQEETATNKAEDSKVIARQSAKSDLGDKKTEKQEILAKLPHKEPDNSKIRETDKSKQRKPCPKSKSEKGGETKSAITKTTEISKISYSKSTESKPERRESTTITSQEIKPTKSKEDLIERSTTDPETSSNESDSSDPKLDLKDFKLNSQCKVILERDLNSLTKAKLKAISLDTADKPVVKENTDITFKKIKNYIKELRKDVPKGADEHTELSNDPKASKEPKEVSKSKEAPKESKEVSKESKGLPKESKELSKESKSTQEQALKSSKPSHRFSKFARENPRDRNHADNPHRINLDSLNSRRDPKKTKRDIQKNKDKVAKDKQLKSVVDKLMLVETGLVPPGTEMDVDLQKAEEDGQKKILGDLRSKIRGADKRDRANRSTSHEPKRRHTDPNKPHKRKGKPVSTSRDHSPSRSPSPGGRALLERRGRYNVTDVSPDRNLRLPISPSRREHSSSSRRTLTIAEDMVRSLQDPDGPPQIAASKGERIPRRVVGRGSRSRSRSYEKYRAYKRSPSPAIRGYGGAGASTERRTKLVDGRETSGKRERSRDRSPIRDRRNASRFERERRDLDLPASSRERERNVRDRSNSPPSSHQRKKAPTFLEELNEKLSKQQSNNPSRERRTFLEEIREKINMANQPLPPMYATRPAPAPVPPPQHFHRQIPPNPIVYDQSFFIGDAPPMIRPPLVNVVPPQRLFSLPPEQTMIPPPVQLMQPMMPPQLPPILQQLPLIAPELSPVPNLNIHQQQQDQVQQQQQHEQQQQKLDKESIAKLFNDKQITLTDFLSITSKVAGSDRPIDVAKKIKVISRCQDAAKVMSKDSKSTGRFLMCKTLAHRSSSVDSMTVDKTVSPLKRNPAIRFRFASKVPPNDDMAYRTSVQLLLHKLGLPDGTEPVRDPTPEPDHSPLPPLLLDVFTSTPLIIQEANNLKAIAPTAPVIVKKEVLQKMCQTDPVNLCRECKVRSQKKFVAVGCQYDEKMFVNVGTQMNGTEDAFTPARAHLQGLLKSRSLASLTPAQILAQVGVAKMEPLKEEPEAKRSRLDLPPAGQWNQTPEEREREFLLSAARRDMYGLSDHQQERHLQQQLQLEIDLQAQKARIAQLQHLVNSRDLNPFQGVHKFAQQGNPRLVSSSGNSGMSGNMLGPNPGAGLLGPGGSFGGPGPSMMGNSNPGFNQGASGPNPGFNQGAPGPNNQNYGGGNRYFN